MMLTGFVLDSSSPALSNGQRILISLRSAYDATYTVALTPNGVIQDYNVEHFINQIPNNIPDHEFDIRISRPTFSNHHRYEIDLPWRQKLVIGDLPRNVFLEITVLTGAGNAFDEKNHVFVIFKDDSAFAYSFNDITETLELAGGYNALTDLRLSSAEIARAMTQRFDSLRQSHAAESISESFQSTLYAITLFLIVVMFTPLGFVHPSQPVAEKNNVILVWQSVDVAEGADVAVTYKNQDGKVESLLGKVISNRGDYLEVSTADKDVQIDSRQLLGKKLFTIPFIGRFFN